MMLDTQTPPVHTHIHTTTSAAADKPIQIQNEYAGFTFPATSPRVVATLDLDECVKSCPNQRHHTAPHTYLLTYLLHPTY